MYSICSFDNVSSGVRLSMYVSSWSIALMFALSFRMVRERMFQFRILKIVYYMATVKTMESVSMSTRE